MNYEGYYNSGTFFEQSYQCYPLSFIDKQDLLLHPVIMPPSTLSRLAYIQIEYPMLFELSNHSTGRVSHCGVLEFIADECLVFLPYWMMENMLLQEGDIVNVKNASLSKGTYMKLQPHTTDFLDLSDQKAILETTLRNYSCLTTGNTIMVAYNNKRYYIDIVGTKPSSAISIIETDCEVDFAPPLDYKELKKRSPSAMSKKTAPEVQEEEPPKKVAKFSPFTGSARRLDGKTSLQSASPNCSPMVKQHQSLATNRTDGSVPSSTSLRHQGN